MTLKYTKADTNETEIIEGCTSIISGHQDNEFYLDVNVSWQQADIIICPVLPSTIQITE